MILKIQDNEDDTKMKHRPNFAFVTLDTCFGYLFGGNLFIRIIRTVENQDQFHDPVASACPNSLTIHWIQLPMQTINHRIKKNI